MNHSEVDVAEYILNNSEELKKTFLKRHNPAYNLFPDNVFDIYLSNFEEGMLSLLRDEVAKTLNLNPEQSFLIDKKFIVELLGDEYLYPPKT